jgi:ribosome-dependent ATPase
MFWRHLIELSRERRVTIFVSTHFMNEAERCDRISLMHHGRVLAVGAPQELTRRQGAATLEDAFISYLEQAEGASVLPPAPVAPQTQATEGLSAAEVEQKGVARRRNWARGWLSRMWAFARREAIELARDRARLAFALLGPIVLLCITAYSVSFDVENIRFTVLDHDQSHLSREFLQHFSGSHYFLETPSSQSYAEAAESLRSNKAQLVVDIPAEFGRDLEAGRRPEIGLFIDGAVPFTAANVRAYTTGIVLEYVASITRSIPGASASLPISVEPRFIYNQEFRSIYAITPGVIMLTLILIPTMLTALGVVREKEIGSITNLYASPATIGEFLIGKQLPYVGLATLSYLSLVLLTILVLDVPLKGSFLALSLGALLFICAATALGLLISAFVRSQVAAIFGTAILCLIPSVNFSGLLYPVSTLTGASYWVGLGFPSSWFQLVSLGCFTKALSFGSFLSTYVFLAGFTALYLFGAWLLLDKQEV